MNFTSPFLMDETWQYICTEVTAAIPAFVYDIPYRPWVFSVLGAVLIGLSGILPLVLIPAQSEDEKNSGANRKYTV